MTTGNTAAMTVSVAGAAPPDGTANDCEELAAKNVEEREAAKERLRKEIKETGGSKQSRKALVMAETAGMTFSSAKVHVPIGDGGEAVRGVGTGCSSGKAAEKSGSGLVEGGKSEAQCGEASVKFCEDSSYTHPKGGYGAHGEAKVLNELAEKAKGNMKGGSILFNVDWRYRMADGKTYKSGMPCRLCYRAICAAAQCGVDIKLCDASGQPQPFDPDKKCEEEKMAYESREKDPAKDPYLQLDRRMGEDPLQGRGLAH